MILKKVMIILYIFCFINIINSCKKNNINIESKESKQQGVIEYTIDFPDTVYVNEPNDGIIHYKSKLDTIISVFGNKEKNRYTRFILKTTNNLNYDFKHLKQTAKDSFGALNNRVIPFYRINFKETGTYYIDGFINDNILIDTIKNKKDNDLLRYIENEERINHKVIVINRPVLKSKTL
tara:strand:- start:209 stop:745 length:537 start_codon:yes stop_codon:yes gene_type:complete